MAALALRSPQFKAVLVLAGVQSVVCSITVDGTLRYTLIKNAKTGETVNFDISELVRDYLDTTYSPNYVPQKVDIITKLTQYSGLNGTGSIVNTVQDTDIGVEGYGTFLQESNPVLPFEGMQLPTYLIEAIPNSGAIEFMIFVPYDVAGHVAYIDSLGVLSKISYNGSDTKITSADGIVCDIKRIDCTKYGIGTMVTFINKFGMQQDLWFFLKSDKKISRTNEGFKSNTITYPSGLPAKYSVQNAANKVFNTQAKQTRKLSSGYYPEFANEYFEQLLLSEYVWITIPQKWETGKFIELPFIVKTSSIAFKTSLNDRLIEYTIEFEEAFDYINNIR